MSENQSLWAIDTWVVSNKVAEAASEDLGRVTESMAKAGQMRAQIKSMQQQNATDAFLLMLLFKYVQDDELLHSIFERVVKEWVSVRIMFAHFLPLFYHEIAIDRLRGIFDQELDLIHRIEINLVGYISYVKGLHAHYPECNDLDHDKYLEFLRQIVAVYHLVDRAGMDEEKRKEFLAILEKEML
jgi:uncharacterized protein (DUF608 family)